MVRRAEEADVQTIVRLAVQFLMTSRYGRLFPVNPALIEHLLRNLMQHPAGVVLVAETTKLLDHGAVDHIIVGFIAGLETIDPYGGTHYAEELAWYVHQDYRTASHGPRLLEAFENWAMARQLSMVKMVAPAGASQLPDYYTRKGYEAVETAFVKRF